METQPLQQPARDAEGVKAQSRAGISLPLCNELSSILIGMALTSREGGEELRQAQDAVRKRLDSFEKFDVVFRRNTADEIHIAVPCYDEFDEMMKEVEKLPDSDLRQVSGGEIIICSAIGIAIGKIGLAAGLGFSVSVGAAGLTGAITGVSLGAVAGGIFVVSMMVAMPVMAVAIGAGAAAGVGIGIASAVGAYDGNSQAVSVNLAS